MFERIDDQRLVVDDSEWEASGDSHVVNVKIVVNNAVTGFTDLMTSILESTYMVKVCYHSSVESIPKIGFAVEY